MAKSTGKKVPLSAADLAAAARLKAKWDARSDRKLTQEKAGHALGITQGAVGHYLRARTALGAAMTVRFANLLGCDPREIRNDLPEIDELLAAGRSRVADGSAVGMYDAYASAGDGHSGGAFSRIGELTFRTGSLERKGIDPAQADVLFVAGRSMEPRLYDGDAILFDRRDRFEIVDGRMYVIEWNEARYVKRLFRELDGRIRVVSDNKAPEYQDRFAALNEVGFSIIGRVRWIGSWEH